MSSQIRANVLRMEPYSPGKPIAEVQRELGLDHVIKLASNENPLGPSPKAVEALKAAADQAHIYPDGAHHEFRQAVASKFNVEFEQVIVGNGSDELIHLLGLLYLSGPDDEVIVGDPSFVRYDAAAHLSESQLTKVPLDSDYRHDLDAMLAACTSKTKLLFIANPNNPTGTYITKSELDALLSAVPTNVTVVLDEAYYEFASDQPDFPNSADYVRAGANVVGLRTLSKAYGLAGIRLGYGFAPGVVADAINRAREPFNVNALAQVAGIAALNDAEHVENTLENNRRGLKRMADAFTALGARPCASYANFLFADLGRPARPVFQALLERGIIVRPGDVFGTPTCLRVSVGTESEVDAFIEAITEVIKEPASA